MICCYRIQFRIFIKKKKKNTIQNQNKEYSETFQGVKEVETGFSYLGVVMEGKL